jgi:hypothetical protein
MISYAACLEGADVVRLFDRRISARRGQDSSRASSRICFEDQRVELLGSNMWRSLVGFGLLFLLLFRIHHVWSEPGYVFDKACLLSYNHMSFGGGPLEVGTEEEAEKLTSQNEMDSANGNFYMTMQLPVHV